MPACAGVWAGQGCGNCGQLSVRQECGKCGKSAASVGSCHFGASWPRIVRAAAMARGISAALTIAVAAAKSDLEHGASRAA